MPGRLLVVATPIGNLSDVTIRSLEVLRRMRDVGFITEALARRRTAGIEPFTVMSCDNIQGNGHVARKMFTAFARLRSAELADWVAENIAFPNSMVDRITPVTTDADRRWHQLAIDTCRVAGVSLLGAFLATPAVVRSFPAPFDAAVDDVAS